jgi:esterase/lipase superfamily enzyme
LPNVHSPSPSGRGIRALPTSAPTSACCSSCRGTCGKPKPRSSPHWASSRSSGARAIRRRLWRWRPPAISTESSDGARKPTPPSHAPVRGWSVLSEQSVLFATNRARDAAAPGIAFSAETAQSLASGQAAVLVPTEIVRQENLARRQINATGIIVQTTAAQRLALACIHVLHDSGLTEAVRARAVAAKLTPGQALVFVPGYNNTFDGALRRAGQIAYDLHFDGPVVAFAWPSQGTYVGYWADASAAKASAAALGTLIEQLVRQGKVKVHFIAHSMGNVVLLNALTDLLAKDPTLAGSIGEIIDASPDLDAKDIEELVASIGKRMAVGGPPRITLYASSNDAALLTSSLAHGLLAARP